MIKFPVINQGITLQEIPGRIAVYFEIGNCTRKCKGCHSEHLQTHIHEVFFRELSEMLDYAKKEKERGATAILLMGGTTNRINPEQLCKAITEMSRVLPVGIYSGADDNSQIHKCLKEVPGLQWLKTGAYVEKLGGLHVPGTNQKFYVKTEGYWVDETSKFQELPLIMT